MKIRHPNVKPIEPPKEAPIRNPVNQTPAESHYGVNNHKGKFMLKVK